MSDTTETTDDKKPPSKRQKRQEVQAAQIYTTPPTPDDVGCFYPTPRKGQFSLNARPVGVYEMGRFRSRPVFGVRN